MFINKLNQLYKPERVLYYIDASDEEIKNFKPVTHFSIQAIFKNNFGEIPATWQMSEKIPTLDSEGRLLDKKIAENFLDKFNSESKNFGKIISVEEKNKIEISFNKPFIYIIKEKNSDSIWFYGTVYEPTIYEEN